MAKTIAILGSGSWGTAIAIHLAKSNQRVLLWARKASVVQELAHTRCNANYLPNITLPPSLLPTASLADCAREADLIIIAVPSHACKGLLEQLPKPKAGIAWLTKGLDPNTQDVLSKLVTAKWGNSFPMAAISGPSFARELAIGLPTAVTVAGNDPDYVQTICNLLHHDNLRAYHSYDLIGLQLCGAIKNVLAIACGISDGLEFGANAKAALITRGLAEMTRLGLKLGAKQETFMGLGGVGDLVLTCTDNQSRNRRFGLLIGQGIKLSDAEKQIGQVVEGKCNATQVCTLASLLKVNMPICQEVQALLQGTTTPRQAVEDLMTRPPRGE